MTLWVRSQNKMSLISPNCVQYISIDGENTHCIIGSGVDLGIYDSKERCLEVLDEIQKILFDAILLVNNSGKETLDNLYGNGIALMNGSEKIEQLGTYVYQMPEK